MAREGIGSLVSGEAATIRVATQLHRYLTKR
jgi:hypothetical protein